LTALLQIEKPRERESTQFKRVLSRGISDECSLDLPVIPDEDVTLKHAKKTLKSY